MKQKILSILTMLALITGHAAADTVTGPMLLVFKLHGQTRKYQFTYTTADDGSVTASWGIERNTRWQSGSFTMQPEAVENGSSLSFLQPEDGHNVTLPVSETYTMISRAAYRQLKDSGSFRYDMTDYRMLKESAGTITVADCIEGCSMTIMDDPELPLILEISDNPLEINWKTDYKPTIKADIRTELALTPEKSGGIYYTYPEPSGKHTPAPAGFTPFYISHYGRHGSRWITSDARYEAVINEFSRNERNMTDLGRDVYDRLLRVWDDARGHGGELTPLGHRQHHAIGRRMAERYPEIFAGAASISARSSTAGRCIMSMAALCEGLKECNPSLHITREAAARHMDYIAYNSPEALRLGADTAPWRERFRAFEDSVLNPERLMASLFIIPDSINNKRALYEGLYWIASDMQNVEPDISFYDIFTAGELFEMWQTINYRMYVANANSAEGDRHGIESARPLLDNIIHSADSAIASGNSAATLRFGHDTHLIRLLALIGIKGCDSRADDPRHYCDIWQDFRISPMAANLQMIFYRNNEGDILVKFLHNEEETSIPINSSTAPYYDWNEVKRHLSRCINSK